MADRKITELTAMSAGTQATGDLLTIVDVSEAAAVDKNKKITVENLFKGIPSNVGIGTSSPGTKLHVVGNQTRIFADSTNASSNVGISFGDNGTTVGGVLYSNTDDALYFQTNGTNERLRIDSSGKVGIGTSSPTSKLEIAGNNAGNDEDYVNVNNAFRFKETDSTLLNGQPTGSILWETSDNSDSGVHAYIACRGSSSGAGQLAFGTGFASNLDTRLFISSTGNVGIGTTTVNDQLHLYKTAGNSILRIENTGNGNSSGIFFVRETSGGTGKGGANIHVESDTSGTAANLIFGVGSNISATGGEAMRLDTSGRLLVGTSTARAVGGESNPRLQIEGAGGSSNSWVNISRFANSAGSAVIQFGKSRSDTPGTYTVVQNNDTLGSINFAGADGTDLATYGAKIAAEVHGTPGANNMPGRLIFSTTAAGASSPTERFRIGQNGHVRCLGFYSNTTASGANMHVESDGDVKRSTSSKKYKTAIEDIENTYSDALLDCRPVWYRSTCTGDNPGYGFWGFIAEEVAEIDPRLVLWKTTEVTYDEKGSAIQTPCDPEPEGVAYDRFVPHLLNLIKRQQAAIETLETKVAALEAG